MLKVLIVDDETVIREGLKTAIPWERMGLQVAGEADNGSSAIEAIRKLEPSIVITDIKMPGQSGLDIARFTAEHNPDIKVIILSGYSDFEFARQAVKWGAFDFILKPTVFSEVSAVIARAVHAVRMEEQRRRDFNRFKNEIKINIGFYRNAFLTKLITTPKPDRQTTDGLADTLALYEMAQDGSVQLLLCKVDEPDALRRPSEEQLRIHLLALQNLIALFFKAVPGAYVVPVKDVQFAVVFRVTQTLPEEELTRLCEELQIHVRSQYLNVTLSIGISSVKATLLELYEAFSEAGEALDHTLYLGKEAVIFYVGLYPETFAPGTPYPAITEYSNSILRALQIGDKDGCCLLLHELFQLLERHQVSRDTVKVVCIELGALAHLSMDSRKQLGVSVNREQFYTDIAGCTTLEKFHRITLHFLIGIAEQIYSKTHTQHKRLVRQVLDFIAVRYKDDLTLAWISEQVHLNASYLSRLLKNECGENFTQLLTKCRIDKAKELLKYGAVKIYEVAERVGIADPHYFAVIFKKHVGMSPSEYRDHFEEIF